MYSDNFVVATLLLFTPFSAFAGVFLLYTQDMRRQANENGESAAVPITVRQLEAIVRLSEALAKMRL